MLVSLDGFVETTDRDLSWHRIDEELHTFANEEARAAGAFLYGRRLYELMAEFWPTADQDPSAPAYQADFARIWKATPKVVFSKTLQRVEWNSRLAEGDLGDEIVHLKAEPGDELTIGGPTLASSAIRRELVDEFRLLVQPVVLGGGTPFFPSLERRINLRLLETRRFQSGVVYLRYQRE